MFERFSIPAISIKSNITRMFIFGLLSALAANIKFSIPGIDGATSDAREVVALLSILFLSNWKYTIGVALLATMGGPYDALITTAVMHLLAIPIAWFFITMLRRRVDRLYILTSAWFIFVIFLYIFIYSSGFIVSEYLLDKIDLSQIIPTYKTFLSWVALEAILTALITTMVIYLILLQLNFEKIEKENMILQQILNHSSKMDALGQLAGGIAHDFNNMLCGIMGAAQLLQASKENLDTKSIEYVNMIVKAATRASHLTDKLLAFGRKSTVASSITDIHTIINDAVEILSKTIDRKINIQVNANAKNSIIMGDNSALQNSLINLGINSSHAMPNGGELIFKTKNIQLNQTYCNASAFKIKPGNYIVISIKDTGSGINKEILDKIFEPFFTTKAQSKGTGLGLSSVYGIVQEHRGAIEVYSTEGSGTTFHIYLPNTKKYIPEPSIEEKENISHCTGKIFLIDDEEIIRITGQKLLENMGFRVYVFENGLSAIEEFTKSYNEIDLVITDMIMPQINGSEVFYKLRKIDNNCKVILSSGFALDEDIINLKKDGLSGFIRKPFKDTELKNLIKHILNTNHQNTRHITVN